MFIENDEVKNNTVCTCAHVFNMESGAIPFNSNMLCVFLSTHFIWTKRLLFVNGTFPTTESVLFHMYQIMLFTIVL